MRTRAVNEPTKQNDVGFLIIGALKVASAVLLGAAGFGIFRLLHKDLGIALEQFVSRLHLDPENRLIHAVLARASGVDHVHLRAVGVGTFFYAILHLVEGTGLLLRRRWASYLTVLLTSSLVPLEGYEVIRKVTAVRVGVLLVNLGIVAYLAVKLWQEHTERAQRTRPARSPGRDPG